MRKFLIGAMLLLTVGCISPAVYVALDRGISANTGHMNDKALPKTAREIAQDNYDEMNQIKFNLNGTVLPKDTAKRVAAREKAAAAAAAAVTSSTGGDK